MSIKMEFSEIQHAALLSLVIDRMQENERPESDATQEWVNVASNERVTTEELMAKMIESAPWSRAVGFATDPRQ